MAAEVAQRLRSLRGGKARGASAPSPQPDRLEQRRANGDTIRALGHKGKVGSVSEKLRDASTIEKLLGLDIVFSRSLENAEGPPPFGVRRLGTSPSGRSFEMLLARIEAAPSRHDQWFALSPRTVLYTGLHARRHFLIENGTLAKAVKNFRFDESPLFMLNNLEGLGRAERVARTEAGGDGVPPVIKVRDFNFTSLSYAV